jgi:hypothetical protein
MCLKYVKLYLFIDIEDKFKYACILVGGYAKLLQWAWIAHFNIVWAARILSKFVSFREN